MPDGELEVLRLAVSMGDQSSGVCFMDSKHIISPQEAQDLLNKLLHEKIPLHSHLLSTAGSVVVLFGFLEKGKDGSLCIAAAGPPIPGASFLVVPMENRKYQFDYEVPVCLYGTKRNAQRIAGANWPRNW